MDATQMIIDSILESDDEENEEENGDNKGRPLAKLCILKNEHIPEGELPLFLGDNVLGRDPNTCTLPLLAPSISKQHATIYISAYRRKDCHSEVDIEALVWDLGSMNGTRKGRLKLTPNVRYALSESDSLVMADIPCKYVSCVVDGVSSHGGVSTPVSRNSGVNARLPDTSAEKGGDISTGSKKCVNGRCLSFEQTPTQPQRTLVPESDSDSEGESKGGGDRRRKALVSDSDSYKSSPTCSTFLSPTNKIVPESEDETPITPSSTKNRPDVDVGRQQLNEKKELAIVDDSEEEGRKEGRAALGAGKSEESGYHVSVEQESNVSLTEIDDLPVSTSAVVTDVIPAFNMDSDTDMEGEEEGVASVGPVTLNTNQQADQPPNTAQFHMDSDTDVDDDDALDKVPKSVPFSADTTRPPYVGSVIQPEGITMDSDTDVDDDAVVSDAATKAKPMSFQSTHTADSAPSSELKDFHLDSDTDVDEEEEKECGTNATCPKIDETSTRLDIKPVVPEHTPASPHNLHLNSDTDDEAVPAPVISEPSVVSAVTVSCTTADTGGDLDILSDSDTDVEDNSPLVVPVVVTTLSVAPHTKSEAFQSDSNADTDVDESSVPPAEDAANLPDLRVDSDTDVKEKKLGIGEAGVGQIPSLRRENTPALLAPLLQNCSTPTPLSEGEIEGMETQAFLSPTTGPYSRRVVVPALRPIGLSSCSDSQEDEDFVVAETQSFVLQTRDCEGNPPGDHTMDLTQSFVTESSGDEKAEQSSRGGSFRLGLSDSSHLQRQAQALAMERTEAFPFVEGAVNLEDTQAYAAISNADGTSCENDSNLEATQAYGEHIVPTNCSVRSEKEGQVDLALEATQAYISEPYSNSEDETDEDERKNTATAETQPLDFPTSSTLAMAETQPMSAFEEEECLDHENPVSSVSQVMPKQNDIEERDEHGEAALPQESHLSEASLAETQPMRTSDDEVETGEVGESDDEDSIPGPRKRKAKPLQLEEEQTQPLTSSETQPMATSGNEESDEEDSIPGPRKRKAKALQLEEEETQPLTSFELSAVETQPMVTGEDGESDDEDSNPGPRKRKAKPLQLEEEQTQPLASSETQPMATSGNEESDEEDLIPGPRKRKAKALQLEEEETQPLINSELSAVETQPTGEGGGNDNEDSVPHTSKRKAKPLQMQEEETQPLTKSEASTVETQPLETKAGLRTQRGKGRQLEAGTSGITIRGKRGTPAKLREEKEQVECSESPKRQTRGKNNASRGRRGKSRPEESEEEGEVEQGKKVRGKKSMRRQNDGEEEEERLKTERNKHADSNTLIKEQEEEQLGEEKDVTELRQQEREKMEKEKREIDEKGKKHRRDEMERERKEKEEQERLQTEHAERLRLERERAEQERIERERKEQEERERADRAQKQKEEQMKRERKEKEEKKRLEHEKAEREERERLEKERIEKQRKEKEEKERLRHEKTVKEERERLEREEKERIEKERKEKEEKERLETAKRELEERLERERKEQEHQARLEKKAKEREERERLEKERQEKEAKEKQVKEQQDNKEEENKPKTPARSRRTRRTIAAPCTSELEQDSAIPTDDDVPARRTRSRSNSSNSVSSERSVSSVNTKQSRGRGRGRGAKRTSEPPQAANARGSNRRSTVAAEPSEQDSKDVFPQGVLSRSNSTNSLSSEISSCSLSSQSRGRGGRQRGRGRKTEAATIPPISSQSDQNSAPKPETTGRKSRKAEESSNEVPNEDKKADSQQASTTRGQQRANANGSEPAAADEEDPSNQEEGCASDEPILPKKNVRGRDQKAVKSSTVEAQLLPAVSDGDGTKEKTKGRKRELEANTEDDSNSSSKMSKGKEKLQITEATKGGATDETPHQAKRIGRAPSAQAKKNVKDSPTALEVKGESEKIEEEAVERRGRGRPSAVQKKKQKEEQEESGTSLEQDAEASEPKTPTSSVSRKRQASVDSSPVAKTPRSSSASPAASGRLRIANQTYKVLFTGVVDEAGERVLVRLGGSMAKGVADMNCLVTDKVRRTVKFLCALAKGVPIVTTHWLEKSGKAGSFLSPNAFIVKDPEQEKKFNFCLQESLSIASSQLLLQGYQIHVTKSVKPEPIQMKDIITCSGATFLPKMPSSHKPHTVVISCEEDLSLCGPALSASLPVVTAEFILTGTLQQKLDFQAHSLSAPKSSLPTAGGRGRGRKKT